MFCLRFQDLIPPCPVSGDFPSPTGMDSSTLSPQHIHHLPLIHYSLLFFQNPPWEMFLVCKCLHNNQLLWSIMTAITPGSPINLYFCKLPPISLERACNTSIILKSQIYNALHLLDVYKYERVWVFWLADGIYSLPCRSALRLEQKAQEFTGIFTGTFGILV